LCDEENVKTVLARVDKWSNSVGERHWGNWSYRSVNCMSQGSGMNSMGKGSVDSVNTVRDNSISSVKSVGGVSHDGGMGSEGLALGGGPVLSLVGLAHGLVAHLAVSVSVDGLVGAIVDGGNSGGDGGVGNRGVDSVSNDGGGVDGMSHDRSGVGNDGGGVDSVGNDGSSVSDNRGSVDGVSDRGIGGGRGGLVTGSRSLRVHSGALIGDISDVSIIAVGGVGHLLDSAVGKGNSVGTLDIAGAIRGLLGVEVGLGVVISNSVGVGVGGDLIGVSLSLVGGGGGVVSGGGVDNGGSVGGGGVHGVSHNRGGVSDQRSGVNGVSHRGGVHGVSDGVSEDRGVGNSVADRGDGVKGDNSGLADRDGPVGAQGGLDLGESLGVVYLGHGGVGGAEGLGLDEASLLTVSGGD